jgi:hypothetical protein
MLDEAGIAQPRADVLAADGKPRKDFRFANERQERDDEPLDLPQLSKARGSTKPLADVRFPARAGRVARPKCGSGQPR